MRLILATARSNEPDRDVGTQHDRHELQPDDAGLAPRALGGELRLDGRSVVASLREAEISKGEWIAPEFGEQKFREYAEQWMRDRVLRAPPAELYDGLLRNHLLPTFGEMSVSDIDEAAGASLAQRALGCRPESQAPVRPGDGGRGGPHHFPQPVSHRGRWQGRIAREGNRSASGRV